MYDKLSNLDWCIERAEEYVTVHDRELYRPYLEAIEEVVRETPGAMFGGAALSPKKTRNSYYFEIYTPDPVNLAFKLADTVGSTNGHTVDSTTAAMDTTIRNQDLTVSVNCRALARVYSFGLYRGKSINSVLEKETRESHITKEQVRTIPSDVHLMHLYRNLYSPSKLSEWESSIDILPATTERGFENIKNWLGGDDHVNTKAAMRILESRLRDHAVFVGEHAVQVCFPGANNPNYQRLQVIVDDLEKVSTIVKNALLEESKSIYLKKFEVEFVQYLLNIPTDFRIRKFTVYIKSPRGNFPVLDIFTSGEFEIIPFVQIDKIRVGAPLVIARFLCIDIWTMRVLSVTSGTNTKTRVRQLLNLLANLQIDITFQTENYFGIHQDEVIARKVLMKKNKPAGRYYPVLNSQAAGFSLSPAGQETTPRIPGL
jgi:hypothetical protein